MEEKFVSSKKSLKGCTQVTFLPPQCRADLIKEYEQADILFLHLNDCESFRKVLPSNF